MSERPRPPKRPRYRDLIHVLNRRYHEQWERAERLEKEVAELRTRRLGPLLSWLRCFKRWLRPVSYTGRPGSRPGELRGLPCQRLAEEGGPVSGRVSIIIPFRDRLELLRGCLRSLRRSTYRDFEVVLVDNGSAEPATRRYLERAHARGGRLVYCPGPFNFARLCNAGAAAARGEFLLFLNNDTEVLTPGWLERLLRVARRPEVGVVGATLLYPDGTIQHAGLFPRAGGHWVHGYRGLPPDAPGDQGELGDVRTVPAVTGACLLIGRELFGSLGGFDERLPTSYNDVDLCCRVRARGLLVAVTPHARLLHFEALSRGYTTDRPGSGHLSALGRFPGPG